MFPLLLTVLNRDDSTPDYNLSIRGVHEEFWVWVGEGVILECEGLGIGGV